MGNSALIRSTEAEHKGSLPSQSMVWLGLRFNTHAMTITIQEGEDGGNRQHNHHMEEQNGSQHPRTVHSAGEAVLHGSVLPHCEVPFKPHAGGEGEGVDYTRACSAAIVDLCQVGCHSQCVSHLWGNLTHQLMHSAIIAHGSVVPRPHPLISSGLGGYTSQ